MGQLDGKVAVVTGAAQGLGEAFVAALHGAGANVVAVDLQAGVARLEAPGVLPIVADVSRRADVEKAVGATIERFGGVDILVNNAGKWTRSLVTDSWEKAVADFDEIMDTNLKGVLMLQRAATPSMIARGGGDIVNISTYYVLPARSEGTNSPETDLYNASKWGLNGFTQAWAMVLKRHNIRVNALAMGACDTPMLRNLWAPGEPPADFAATWMKPEQIGQLLLDLLADGRTGENIGAWVGYPLELPTPPRPDSTLRMRPDFTGRPGAIYSPPPWDDLLEPVPVDMRGPRR